jgi:DNA-directed RNA polymerase specialized sigma subunit
MPILPPIRLRSSLDEKLTTWLDFVSVNNNSKLRWIAKPEACHVLDRLKEHDEVVRAFYQTPPQRSDWNQLATYLVETWAAEYSAMGWKRLQKNAEKYGSAQQLNPLQLLLSAYLDEAAYRAVEQTAASWYRVKSYTWEDWFYTVRGIINDPEQLGKIVENFLKARQEEQKPICEKYFQGAFAHKIVGELEKFGVKRASSWRLLCKANPTEIREALSKQGLTPDEIGCRLFAWSYFTEVYQENRVNHPDRKVGDRWPEPHAEDYEEVAIYYNTEKELLSAPLEVFSDRERTCAEIQTWLEECINALRDSPLVVEFNLKDKGQLENAVPRSELGSRNSETYRRSYFQEVEGMLVAEVEKLDGTIKQAIARGEQKDYTVKILPLRYGVGLSQTVLAKKFGVNQAQISRREAEYLEHLLYVFCVWIGDGAGISLADVKNSLEQWLKGGNSGDFSDSLQGALSQTFHKMDFKKQRNILQLRYQQKKSDRQIARHLKLPRVKQVMERLTVAKRPLERVILIHFWLSDAWEMLLLQAYQNSVKGLDSLSEKVLEAVGNLDVEQQKLLRDIYGVRRSVAEVSAKLDCPGEILQEKIKITHNHLQGRLYEKVTEFIIGSVKNLLKCHYQPLVMAGFTAKNPEGYELLQLYYRERLNARKIADRLSIARPVTVEEVVAQQSQAETQLLEEIRAWCATHLQVSLGDRELKKVLKKWF